jgi:hypothetical protein
VAVLFIAGNHVPVIPLLEVTGKLVSNSPSQIAATGSNIGITVWVTVMVIVLFTAQA